MCSEDTGRLPLLSWCFFRICVIGWSVAAWRSGRVMWPSDDGAAGTRRLMETDGRGADLGFHPTRWMVTQWDQKKDGPGNTQSPASPSGSWYWLSNPITLGLFRPFPAHRPEPEPAWKWEPQAIKSSWRWRSYVGLCSFPIKSSLLSLIWLNALTHFSPHMNVSEILKVSYSVLA